MSAPRDAGGSPSGVAPFNVLVLTYWSYKDALIQTYTLPYVRLIRRQLPPGSRVFLVTREHDRLQLTPAEAERAERELREEGIELVRFEYARFGLRAAAGWGFNLVHLVRLCLAHDIQRIHAWCTPAGAPGYLLAKLIRKPLVIDSYEPHAESMVENGTWSEQGVAYRILFALERLQSREATAVIATSAGMREYARTRYDVEFERFYVKPSCVDLELFRPAPRDPALVAEYGLEGKLVCVYAGKIGGIYLEREIFDFLRVAYEHWGDRFRVLMLTSSPLEQVRELAAVAGLPDHCYTARFVAHADVARHLALADFALNPVKPVPTKRYCTSIKDGEYWATGLPVVITRDISDDSEIIERHGIGAVLRDCTEEEYRAAVRRIDDLLRSHSREELSAKVRAVAAQYRDFAVAERIYSELYSQNGTPAEAAHA